MRIIWLEEASYEFANYQQKFVRITRQVALEGNCFIESVELNETTGGGKCTNLNEQL